MTTTQILLTLLGGALLPVTAFAQSVASDRADDIHRRVLVLDGHADVLLPTTAQSYYLPDGGSRVELPRLTQGGVDAIVLSLAVGPGPRDAAGIAAARADVDAKLARIRDIVAANPQRIAVATSAADIERLRGEGKVAVLIGFQNARSIGQDLAQIDHFYAEGVRVFGFNHAGHNDFSDSSRPQNAPASEHGGLSPLGQQAVGRLNDLGVLIDVSQLSSQALAQVLQLTRVPVAATHSGARGLVDSGRNLADAELDAIRANGGVVQVTPFTTYLRSAGNAHWFGSVRERFGLSRDATSPEDGIAALSEDRRRAYLGEIAAGKDKATLEEYVDHIDYIARRIGWQHVGIGSDFDHGAGVVGFDSEAEAPNVTRELLRRGYNEEQIAGIWGGNFLRVLRDAERGRKS